MRIPRDHSDLKIFFIDKGRAPDIGWLVNNEVNDVDDFIMLHVALRIAAQGKEQG